MRFFGDRQSQLNSCGHSLMPVCVRSWPESPERQHDSRPPETTEQGMNSKNQPCICHPAEMHSTEIPEVKLEKALCFKWLIINGSCLTEALFRMGSLQLNCHPHIGKLGQLWRESHQPTCRLPRVRLHVSCCLCSPGAA